MTYKWFTPGIPQPGGSKRVFMPRGARFPVITEDNPKSKDWRASVAFVASEHIRVPLTGPVALRIQFVMPRPRGHFGKKGLRASAPQFHTTRPDCSKLTRSSEDALKGIAWLDDSQVVKQVIEKCYGESPGAWIEVIQVNETAGSGSSDEEF